MFFKREVSASGFPVWAGYPRQIVSVLLGACIRTAPVRPANRPITGRGPSACTTATVSVPETMIAQAHEHSQATRLNRPRCAVIGFVGDADYRDMLSLPWTFHLTPQGGPRKVFGSDKKADILSTRLRIFFSADPFI